MPNRQQADKSGDIQLQRVALFHFTAKKEIEKLPFG